MATVDMTITNDHVELSTEERSWRASHDNSIVVRRGNRGHREIVGIADQGDAARTAVDTTIARAFDSAQFDPDLSASATRYFVFQAMRVGLRRSLLRTWLSRPTVRLIWTEWHEIPTDARVRYLRAAAAFADVVVNGQRAATWSTVQQLLRRPPTIANGRSGDIPGR
jgi:hypothetical protein